MGRTVRRAAICASILVPLGCRSPDPKALLEVKDLETHWAVDSSTGQTRYIAPVVRFRIHNRSADAQGSVQATATFRRKGEENLTWGSDFRQVASRKEPLPAGQDTPVMLKSDARYYSSGEPETMFQHAQFKDAKVEVFLRVGSSGWTSFGAADIDRRIGARSVQSLDSAATTPLTNPSPMARD